MSAQKRLRMRLSELDVLCGNDRGKATLKRALAKNMSTLFATCASCDRQRTTLCSGLDGCGRLREQDTFLRNRLKVIDALAMDQFIEFRWRQMPGVLGKQHLEAIPVV